MQARRTAVMRLGTVRTLSRDASSIACWSGAVTGALLLGHHRAESTTPSAAVPVPVLQLGRPDPVALGVFVQGSHHLVEAALLGPDEGSRSRSLISTASARISRAAGQVGAAQLYSWRNPALWSSASEDDLDLAQVETEELLELPDTAEPGQVLLGVAAVRSRRPSTRPGRGGRAPRSSAAFGSTPRPARRPRRSGTGGRVARWRPPRFSPITPDSSVTCGRHR